MDATWRDKKAWSIGLRRSQLNSLAFCGGLLCCWAYLWCTFYIPAMYLSQTADVYFSFTWLRLPWGKDQWQMRPTAAPPWLYVWCQTGAIPAMLQPPTDWEISSQQPLTQVFGPRTSAGKPWCGCCSLHGRIVCPNNSRRCNVPSHGPWNTTEMCQDPMRMTSDAQFLWAWGILSLMQQRAIRPSCATAVAATSALVQQQSWRQAEVLMARMQVSFWSRIR